MRELFKKRYERSAFNTLIPELIPHDREFLYGYLKMSLDRLELLLTLIAPLITKKYCPGRDPISASERLIVTLRYLATGESQQTQSFYFRISRHTVSKRIDETCNAIWDGLKSSYLKAPTHVAEWQKLAKVFNQESYLPNCIGAIDGKHVCIEAPPNSRHHTTIMQAFIEWFYCHL